MIQRLLSRNFYVLPLLFLFMNSDWLRAADATNVNPNSIGTCPRADEIDLLEQPIGKYSGIWYEIYTYPSEVDACPCRMVNNTVFQKRGRNFIQQNHYCYSKENKKYMHYSEWEFEELTENLGNFMARKTTSLRMFTRRHSFMVIDWDDEDTYVGMACDPGYFISKRSFRIMSRVKYLDERNRGKFAAFLESQGANWYKSVYATADNFYKCR